MQFYVLLQCFVFAFFFFWSPRFSKMLLGNDEDNVKNGKIGLDFKNAYCF